MSQKFQVHLTGKGHTGRVVRYEILDPDVVEVIQLNAAKSLGSEGSVYEHAKRTWREGVKHMVTEFSAPTDNPTVEGLKWTKSSPEVLQEIGKVFLPKDVAVLESIYRDWHEVSEKAVDDIAGKALPVSGG